MSLNLDQHHHDMLHTGQRVDIRLPTRLAQVAWDAIRQRHGDHLPDRPRCNACSSCE